MVVGLTGCPCVRSAAASWVRLLHVQRRLDSGSPRPHPIIHRQRSVRQGPDEGLLHSVARILCSSIHELAMIPYRLSGY